jgi:hypothetical protein
MWPGSLGPRYPVRRDFRTGTAEMVYRQVQRRHAAPADQEDGGEKQRFRAAEGDGAHGLRGIYHYAVWARQRGG